MKNFKLLSVIILFSASLSIYSQVSVTSYSIYALGLSTSKENKFSGEVKCFFNNSTIDDAFLELSGMYNFKPSKYHQFSVGLGVGGFGDKNILNSFTMPIQLELFPLQDFKRFSVIFELAPRLGEDISIRHLWGLKYTF